MRTIAPPAATPGPDAGYQAMLDQLAAAVDRIRRQVSLARHAEPGRRTSTLADLATHLHSTGEHLREQLRQETDNGWPPLPATDEAP